MIVEQYEPKKLTVNKPGKWHFKVINVEEEMAESQRREYLKVTCLTQNDRIFKFDLHPNTELFHQIAQAIGLDNCSDNSFGTGEIFIDSDKFVGGFFRAILSEYRDGISGYWIRYVWPSPRRYDMTKSPTFKRVRVSDRKYSVYEELAP